MFLDEELNYLDVRISSDNVHIYILFLPHVFFDGRLIAVLRRNSPRIARICAVFLHYEFSGVSPNDPTAQ